jgi:uncharacterized protein YaaW (UPF0174 family)
MWMVVNVALQSVLSTAIKVVGVTGAEAAAMNLGGQAVIHTIATVAAPVGWVLTGASVAYTIAKQMC